MSDSMSMFKKMKERITEEVNSATTNIQNMQIFDQLASSMTQQVVKDEIAPNQLLPEPYLQETGLPRNNQFSLVDDGPIEGFNERDELNSEISPQHQLFNEQTIKRLNPEMNDVSQQRFDKVRHSFGGSAEIDVQVLSSDLDDDLDGSDSRDDMEIDILSDKIVAKSPNASDKFDKDPLTLLHYRTKYRNVVHALRVLYQNHNAARNELETQRQELTAQITALKKELELAKQQQQHDSLTSTSTSVSETDKSSVGSPQPTTKAGSKIRDLERLLSKCKESLKLKNTQINTLKNSLSEVEKFKEYNQQLKSELAELREAHETWTVSIAENKRVMHQEIEDKNAEMVKQRAEANELQNKLNASNNKIRQLKSAVQDLESRLVSTSAAHQKERESLTKELNLAKMNAIKQQQKEHEHNLERVKLDLEKSIESLKAELLSKDEQVVRSVEQQQHLNEINQKMTKDLETLRNEFQNKQTSFDELNSKLELESKRFTELENEISRLRSADEKCRELESGKKELELSVEELKAQLENYDSQLKDVLAQLDSANATKTKLEDRLTELSIGERDCPSCIELRKEISTSAEKFNQELHELHNKLNLMTAANDDQEKEIKSLRSERDSIRDSYKHLKADSEELSKKNESLTRIIRENEVDLQAHQDQLDRLTITGQEVEQLKKENLSHADSLNRLKADLRDKNIEIAQYKAKQEELSNVITGLKTEVNDIKKLYCEAKKDGDGLAKTNEELIKHEREQSEKLVVSILSVMKNLESPTTSPRSDKSYDSSVVLSDGGEFKNKELPNPATLMDELSSAAVDRCQAYVTTSQRLQAVLIENKMIKEELERMRDEINNVNREKTLETQSSIDVAEELRTENQALINDQLTNEERIKSLENELDAMIKERDEETSQKDANKALIEEMTEKLRNLEGLCQNQSDELLILKESLTEKDDLNYKRLSDLEDRRSMLESYQKQIEDLEEQLNELETENQNLARFKEQMEYERSHLKGEDREEIGMLESNGFKKAMNDSYEAENKYLKDKVSALEAELDTRQLSEGSSGDHSYQLKALQRVLQQYQEENQRLKASHKNLTEKIEQNPESANIPDSTEFEYLKNIVHQFMLGKEPLVLARVISAIFKFDKTQVDHICKVQETVQAALRQGVRQV